MSQAETTTQTEQTVGRSPKEKTAKDKPTAAKAETAFEPFAVQGLEVPELVRDLAERAVNGARSGYEVLRSAAEDATEAAEETFEATRTGFVDAGRRLLELAQGDADAAFAFARNAIAAKTVAEVIELQSAFLRQQFDALTTRSREMQELATKLATETTTPLRDVATKSARWFKAA